MNRNRIAVTVSAWPEHLGYRGEDEDLFLSAIGDQTMTELETAFPSREFSVRTIATTMRITDVKGGDSDEEREGVREHLHENAGLILERAWEALP